MRPWLPDRDSLHVVFPALLSACSAAHGMHHLYRGFLPHRFASGDRARFFRHREQRRAAPSPSTLLTFGAFRSPTAAPTATPPLRRSTTSDSSGRGTNDRHTAGHIACAEPKPSIHSASA